jgi:hypothetical protein
MAQEETARDLVEDSKELLAFIDPEIIRERGLVHYPEKLRLALAEFIRNDQWLRDRIERDKLI